MKLCLFAFNQKTLKIVLIETLPPLLDTSLCTIKDWKMRKDSSLTFIHLHISTKCLYIWFCWQHSFIVLSKNCLILCLIEAVELTWDDSVLGSALANWAVFTNLWSFVHSCHRRTFYSILFLIWGYQTLHTIICIILHKYRGVLASISNNWMIDRKQTLDQKDVYTN